MSIKQLRSISSRQVSMLFYYYNLSKEKENYPTAQQEINYLCSLGYMKFNEKDKKFELTTEGRQEVDWLMLEANEAFEKFGEEKK
ncbi:MAG: hypothetical protein AABY32_01115 [Nanoarchaeota archaeon]